MIYKYLKYWLPWPYETILYLRTLKELSGALKGFIREFYMDKPQVLKELWLLLGGEPVCSVQAAESVINCTLCEKLEQETY